MLTRLPLKVQKAIIGQWILDEVLERSRVVMNGDGHGAVWNALVSRGRDHAALEFEGPNDDQTVEEYLNGLLGSVDGFRAPSGTDSACNEIKAELRSEIEGYCQAPHDPLLREFANALAVTAEFYRRSGIEIPRSMLEQATFEAGWAERRPHDYPAPHELGGVSTVSSRALGVKVGLTVVPLRLDWRTRVAAPYVLLHELVSHAFVGPWSPEIRALEEADIRFAEGWMDAVAFQVHTAAMEASAGEGAFGASFGHEPECLMSAGQLHVARYEPAEPPQAYAARDLGRQAANRVLGTLNRLPETEPDPLGAFWRLSASLNTSELSQLDRHSLVLELARRLGPSKLSQAPPVIAVVRDWAARSAAAGSNQEAWDAALKFARAIVDL